MMGRGVAERTAKQPSSTRWPLLGARLRRPRGVCDLVAAVIRGQQEERDYGSLLLAR